MPQSKIVFSCKTFSEELSEARIHLKNHHVGLPLRHTDPTSSLPISAKMSPRVTRFRAQHPPPPPLVVDRAAMTSLWQTTVDRTADYDVERLENLHCLLRDCVYTHRHNYNKAQLLAVSFFQQFWWWTTFDKLFYKLFLSVYACSAACQCDYSHSIWDVNRYENSTTRWKRWELILMDGSWF